jgi:plasminogen activator inhibitor 1 RNA-binding protein
MSVVTAIARSRLLKRELPVLILVVVAAAVALVATVENSIVTLGLARSMCPAQGAHDSAHSTNILHHREHEKQVEHGWGGNTGEKEWSDELAGAELAQKDAAGVDASGADPNANTEGVEGATATEEEEEKVKTYDDYLAELAARQANLGPRTEVRRPNEGTHEDKKWANAKPLSKVEGEGEYFIGESKDKTRNRERKAKQLLDIEPRYVDQNKRGASERGGGRGRGSDRGGRGGRGSDRNAPRSDRGNRGGKVSVTNVNINVNINDSSTFPALGA